MPKHHFVGGVAACDPGRRLRLTCGSGCRRGRRKACRLIWVEHGGYAAGCPTACEQADSPCRGAVRDLWGNRLLSSGAVMVAQSHAIRLLTNPCLTTGWTDPSATVSVVHRCGRGGFGGGRADLASSLRLVAFNQADALE